MNLTFLAAHWGFLLLITFVLYMIASILQLRNMSAISRFDISSDNFIWRFAPVMILGLLGTVTGFLFVIGVLADLSSR